jgi:hypothetical protein
MLKQRGDSIAVWLFAGDMLLTLVALALARWLRTVLPFGMQIDAHAAPPDSMTDVSDFRSARGRVLILPVYDSRRSLQ